MLFKFSPFWIALLLALAVPAGTGVHGQQTAPPTAAAMRDRLVLEAAYREKLLLGAADARCTLLAGNARLTAQADRLRARGAFLRAGAPDDTVARIEADSRATGATIACTDTRLQATARTARAAHIAWAGGESTTLPAYRKGWTLTLTPGSPWVATQDIGTPERPVRIGLVTAGGMIALALETPDPVAVVQLKLRDPARSPRPQLTPGRAAAPAASIARTFLPQRRVPAPTPPLARVPTPPATLFFFPDAALDALSALDPREGLTVTVTSGGTAPRNRSLTLNGEVGDFGAAVLLASAR